MPKPRQPVESPGMKLKQAVNEIETKRTSLDSVDNEIMPGNFSSTVDSRDSFGM